MKAVVCQDAALRVEDLPEPGPGRGQVLVRVERCGIRGSDLRMRHPTDHMKELLRKVGAGDIVPSSRDALVYGHEFCCEVLDHGPGCERRIRPGTPDPPRRRRSQARGAQRSSRMTFCLKSSYGG